MRSKREKEDWFVRNELYACICECSAHCCTKDDLLLIILFTFTAWCCVSSILLSFEVFSSVHYSRPMIAVPLFWNFSRSILFLDGECVRFINILFYCSPCWNVVSFSFRCPIANRHTVNTVNTVDTAHCVDEKAWEKFMNFEWNWTAIILHRCRRDITNSFFCLLDAVCSPPARSKHDHFQIICIQPAK